MNSRCKHHAQALINQWEPSEFTFQRMDASTVQSARQETRRQMGSTSTSTLDTVQENDSSLPGVRLLAAVAERDEQLRSEGTDPTLSAKAPSPEALSDYGDQQCDHSDYSDEYDTYMDEEED